MNLNTAPTRTIHGHSWKQILESGGFLVGKGVKVEADIEAVAGSANADR
jgi:hypothetical protein